MHNLGCHYNQVRTQYFLLGVEGADPEIMYNLCLIFKNYVLKIMSNV